MQVQQDFISLSPTCSTPLTVAVYMCATFIGRHLLESHSTFASHNLLTFANPSPDCGSWIQLGTRTTPHWQTGCISEVKVLQYRCCCCRASMIIQFLVGPTKMPSGGMALFMLAIMQSCRPIGSTTTVLILSQERWICHQKFKASHCPVLSMVTTPSSKGPGISSYFMKCNISSPKSLI